MDNINVGYNAGDVVGKNTNLRVGIAVQNLFIITKYKGVDPELNLNIDNQLSGQFIGVDSNNFYPKTRSFLAGVQVDL
jgi:iron complex outermembrane receptor protein